MNKLDASILLALRHGGEPLGPAWLQRAAVDVTALGGHAVLTLLVLAATGLLVVAQRRRTAVWLLLSVAGAMLLSHALKVVFARDRPELVEHMVIVVTSSFPSGHALLSASVYPLLAALLGREASRPLVRRYLFQVAVVLALLIGLSRIYLGVHWPSDVLGGWAIGSLWAWACWNVRPDKGVAANRT